MAPSSEPPPAWFRAANRVLAPVARRVRLDPADLLATAMRRTGRHRLAEPDVVAPLEVLTRALETEADLHPVGRVQVRMQLTGLLSARLRRDDLLQRRPEILDAPVRAPIVVAGLPRTGTTLVQRLLACDTGLRHLPYWEALTPLPLGDLDRPPPVPDPRIRRADQSLKVLHAVAPRMIAMHEMETHAADEEIWLLALDLATMLFEASYHVPSYRDWYLATDQTAAYRSLRRTLQVLSWHRPGGRWLLKSPQHLEQLPALQAAFPDATVVVTHRDPAVVTASLAAMIAYGRRTNSRTVDPVAVGRYWSTRVERMLTRSLADRPSADDARYLDVRFDDLVADPIAAVRRIYERAERTLSPDAEMAMHAYLARRPRHHHGRHAYRARALGIDPDERRRALAAYVDRFGVATEAVADE